MYQLSSSIKSPRHGNLSWNIPPVISPKGGQSTLRDWHPGRLDIFVVDSLAEVPLFATILNHLKQLTIKFQGLVMAILKQIGLAVALLHMDLATHVLPAGLGRGRWHAMVWLLCCWACASCTAHPPSLQTLRRSESLWPCCRTSSARALAWPPSLACWTP